MSDLYPDHSVNMSGKIDLAFGEDGVVNINVPGASTVSVNGVLNGADNRLYVLGTANIQLRSRFFITALNQKGEVITDFGNNGYVIDFFDGQGEDAYGEQLKLAGEKLLLVGASYIRGNPFPALAQFDLNGKIDPAFGENGRGKIVFNLPFPPGAVSDPTRRDVFEPGSTSSPGTQQGLVNILDDGKILLSHYFFRTGEPSYGLIIRTLANGLLDTDFATTGYLPVIVPGYENGQTQITSITVDSQGRYVACGSVYALGSEPVLTFFARYNCEGKPDASFGSQGFRIIQDATGLPGGARSTALIPLQEGGMMSLGGSIHDPYIGQLLMLNDRGDLDPVFNSGEPLNTQLAKSSTIWRAFVHQTDGKLVVVGGVEKSKNSLIFDIVVARFDQSGELDADFNDGLGWARTRLSPHTDAATAVTLQNDKIVIGGLSQNRGVVVRYHR